MITKADEFYSMQNLGDQYFRFSYARVKEVENTQYFFLHPPFKIPRTLYLPNKYFVYCFADGEEVKNTL